MLAESNGLSAIFTLPQYVQPIFCSNFGKSLRLGDFSFRLVVIYPRKDVLLNLFSEADFMFAAPLSKCLGIRPLIIIFLLFIAFVPLADNAL